MRLKLASFNIQTGIHSAAYRHYLTRSWQHLLPTESRRRNLDRIAELLRGFDMVGLQEVDGGSHRSGYVVQTEYLARRAGFQYWHNQVNRRLGRLALHSNGLLSRFRPVQVREYGLPGVPGRGLFMASFGSAAAELHICVAHLALGRRARLRQVAFICETISELRHVALMGDLNCEPGSSEMRLLYTRSDLQDPVSELKTFPSWRPRREFDHILATSSLQVENLRVLRFACSDHLPVAMDLILPDTIAGSVSGSG